MFKAKYKENWHSIKDIAKSDNDIVYQLDGIDKNVYAKDISDLDIKKDDTHEIVNPDGSIKRGPGKEPLMKPLSKNIKDRWSMLKAEINHEKAFMQMIDDDEQDEENQNDEAGTSNDQADDNLQPNEAPLPEENAEPEEEQPENAEPEEEQPENAEPEEEQPEEEQPEEDYNEEELIDLLRQEGYSDSEIAHIVHGHVPDDQQQESDMAQSENDFKQAHAKRMADLEHDHAQKEKELKLKYLEEELKAKLENIKSRGK